MSSHTSSPEGLPEFEIGPIRPPSEARSLLIRATRNCPWNRCRFCHTYKGQKFSLRSLEEVKGDIDSACVIRDIIQNYADQSGLSLEAAAGQTYSAATSAAVANVALWLNAGGENAFLQDANSLIVRTPDLSAALRYLRESLPSIKRVTSYGRSHTAMRKSPAELKEIHEAGLTRLHIGMETGYDRLLEYMEKGVTAAGHIEGGRRVVESGISLSEYVILGLGGREMWREHAAETARVLNEINPDFIRVRTLAINGRVPLHEQADAGEFLRASEDEIIAEEKLLIESLTCRAAFVSDHITNLLEIEGNLSADKPRMLAIIDRFLALSAGERLHFRLGRRVGIYGSLDGLADPEKRQAVEQVAARLSRSGRIDEKMLQRLTSHFI